MILTARCVVACLACLLLLARVANAQIQPGDLLVTDSSNDQVLRVDPATGTATPLSPREGSGPNLLDDPAGVALDTSGTVFVVNEATSRLIAVNASTGAQQVVMKTVLGFPGPVDLGDSPYGLDLGEPSALTARPAYIASDEAIYFVGRSILGVSSGVLVSDVLLAGARGLAVATSGLLAPLTILVAADAGLVEYDDDTGSVSPSGGANGAGAVDVAVGDPSPIAWARNTGCSDPADGIYTADGALSTGDLLECPTALSFAPGATAEAFDLYVLGSAAAGGTPRIVRIRRQPGQADVATPVAELAGTTPRDLTVVASVPEPGATALGAAALLALARKRAQRARSEAKPSEVDRRATLRQPR